MLFTIRYGMLSLLNDIINQSIHIVPTSSKNDSGSGFFEDLDQFPQNQKQP